MLPRAAGAERDPPAGRGRTFHAPLDRSAGRGIMEIQPVTDDQDPDFAREALDGSEPAEKRELLELVHRLPDALPAQGLPPALRARLLHETSQAPERYAPFTRTLSELYDLPREQVRALLTRSADPRAWKRSGLPGIKKLPVEAGPSCRGAQTYLVTFQAGVSFPEHHHDGLETVMLLAGAYTESTGKRFVTGDIHLAEPGTAHSFTIDKDEDCVAATLLHGRLNFSSVPLRLLARLLGH
jgi:predicted ChrR family anti-sigma factor